MPPGRTHGYATGQVLAMIAILLVCLPLLPFVLLFVAWVRLRDRLAARASEHEPAHRLTARTP
ncbi:hypothetical protein K1W54_36890 [Micromonospora sp. CPCC 205371]|nr:hypothetical protein [Micromonospora sp. CPCC 205371]